MNATAKLTLAEAIAAAQAHCTLEPDEGWRFHNGRTTSWRGWRVSFVDRRGRPRRVSFLLYHDVISRAMVLEAIAAWFHERGR